MPAADDSARPILIAYDGSDPARAAIAEAARLYAGRRTVVACAWRSISATVPAGLAAVPASVAYEGGAKIDEASESDARALADEGAAAARDAGLDAEARAIEAPGAVWPAIVEAADELDAAAVVLGSRGRSGVKAAILGSVSTGVLHHCVRPVTIVRAVHTADRVPT